jgi:hypothetical protein
MICRYDSLKGRFEVLWFSTGGNVNIQITEPARKFMRDKDIREITFQLISQRMAGSFTRMFKEIEPIYAAPVDARCFRYFHAEGRHIFVSRDVKIIGPLRLDTEGFWKLKRLSLYGATIPL